MLYYILYLVILIVTFISSYMYSNRFFRQIGFLTDRIIQLELKNKHQQFTIDAIIRRVSLMDSFILRFKENKDDD